jgi:hypothetical protein
MGNFIFIDTRQADYPQ